jgi:uncharacterized protein (TIGR02444 family)
VSLWAWALEAYAQEGVAQACLALQDDHGQNVPFLLWAVWAEGADEAALAEGASLAAAWDERAVKPLRQARRGLKPALAGLDDRGRETLREDVKAMELQAERLLLDGLERLCGGQAGGLPALAALQAASRAWGVSAPDEALARLAGALS